LAGTWFRWFRNPPCRKRLLKPLSGSVGHVSGRPEAQCLPSSSCCWSPCQSPDVARRKLQRGPACEQALRCAAFQSSAIAKASAAPFDPGRSSPRPGFCCAIGCRQRKLRRFSVAALLAQTLAASARWNDS
jgi:hypothetical protein